MRGRPFSRHGRSNRRERIGELPEVPTFAESGVPGYEVVSWSGIYVPAGTPRGMVNQLNAAINRMVRQPEARERLLSLGSVPVGGTPAALGDYLKFEIARWAKVVRDAGIKLE
jgi:tripartite-type tricarboxylate transporter receptor subunit TctC